MRHLAIAVLAAVLPFCSSIAEAGDAAPVLDPGLPNFAALGLGFTPDYLGSDDLFWGALPLARYTFTETQRYIALTGTYVDVNLIDDPVLRFGPTVQYRFGRENVDDDVVSKLPDIDSTIEAGVFGALEYVDSDDARRRLRLGTSIQHDVLDVSNGLLANVSVQAWQPIEGWFELNATAGTTWANEDYTSTYFDVTPAGAASSELPVFSAGSGFRDARLTLGVLMPITKNWVIGAGLMYQRLLGDAADSPIVADRGSANQFSGGIGVGYSW